MDSKAQETEARVDGAASKDEAISYAVAAADLYMKAIKLASSAAERTRLQTRCMKILERAEEIKKLQNWPPPSVSENGLKFLKAPVSERPLSIREQRIVLESSRLHGLKFPPWQGDPDPSVFERQDGRTPFTDDLELELSKIQLKAFAGWKRPRDALRKTPSTPGQLPIPVVPTMRPTEKIDLVQDVTADCSVVASLCSACTRGEGGYVKLLSAIMYPYSREEAAPKLSPSGKYMFRFHFNGCFRQVIVDDRLPASKNSRTLFVTDRRNPGLLWPALLEKAYLKMRGGYDFPGSNSGTDLWVLTGWIPEQIFLQSDELRPQDLWTRVHKAYDFGDVILTLGTGRLTQREEEGLGLAGEHDYAVLSMREVRGQRMLLVKNPWCDGMVWKESGHIPTETSEEWASELREALPEVEKNSPGTFWMPFDQTVRNFESMYLNWNPGLFRHRQDHHFSWTIPQRTAAGCFSQNPQYSIRCSKGGTVWVLLSKHFTTEEYNISKKIVEGSSKSKSLGFISLYSFDVDGKKVHVSDDPLSRGPFVDSPQTLARLEMPAKSRYTLVTAQQDLPLAKYSFTLSVFSRSLVEVQPAEDPYPHEMNVQGAWTSRTAGGNASSPSYACNPQFSIDVPTDADMTLLVETDRSELPVHVKLVWAGGERVSAVTSRDIVGESGEYTRGFTFVNLKSIAPGRYTIVCSTFEAGQKGNFTLSVLSTAQCQIKPVAAEAAGKLSLRLPILVMPAGTDRMLAPITVTRLTQLRITAKHAPSSIGGIRTHRTRTPLRSSVEQSQGPHKRILGESSLLETFSEARTGAKTGDVDVTPEMCQRTRGGLWLTVERLPGGHEEEVIEVEVLSDAAVDVGSWGVGTG